MSSNGSGETSTRQKLETTAFYVVQILVAIVGYMISNTLTDLRGTLKDMQTQSLLVYGRVANLEGRFESMPKIQEKVDKIQEELSHARETQLQKPTR